MFSNDNNINTIAQLVEAIKHNIGLQGEYLKLDITEKTVRILTAILLLVIFSLVLLAILTYLSFAAAFALATYIGVAYSFCVVASAYILLLIICILFKKQLIEKPLVRFFASLLS